MRVSYELEQCIDAVSDLHIGRLQFIGITGRAIANAGLIGISKIEIDDRYWHPEESGSPALIVPVGCDNLFSAFVDLVAFHTSKPDAWWVRTGHGPLLGYRNLERAAFYGTQLTVHRNPLQWLQSECEGVCLVDWDGRCLPLWFSRVQHVFCPDP